MTWPTVLFAANNKPFRRLNQRNSPILRHMPLHGLYQCNSLCLSIDTSRNATPQAFAQALFVQLIA
jgi:hypothetical protein